MGTKQYKTKSKLPALVSEPDVLYWVMHHDVNSTHLAALKTFTGLSDLIISGFLHIDVKTFRNYKSSKMKLSVDMQERVVMLSALFRHGRALFGSAENFDKWLQTENFYFGKKPPLAYLTTISGIKFTDDQLTGLEYGDNA